MDTRLSLKAIFLFLLLLLILPFPATAVAQTAPVCGSGGPVTPGSFTADLTWNIDGIAMLGLTFSGVTPPVEYWLDPGTPDESFIGTWYAYPGDGSILLTFPAMPPDTNHIVAFVTPGYAPVCLTVPAQPSPVPVPQDAYPIKPETLPASLPGTGFLLLPLAGGAACAGLGLLLARRRQPV